MYSIDDICDYIIFRLKVEGNTPLSNIKLQKLLYYTQAWYLAHNGNDKPLFNANFQAWIHGPVSRTIFDRFKDSKFLYSEISLDDIIDRNIIEKLDEDVKTHVDNVLESYALYSGIELEDMSHQEKPWQQARGDFAPNERCENEISNEVLGDFFRARI